MSKFVTYVIRLPKGQDAKTKITTGVRTLVKKHGGEITAASNEDEMTILDMIEQHEDFPKHIAEDARTQAKELCAKAGH
ncbi:hypothetical protein ACFQDN_21860 [Pseudomonas asuensis]|uniref:Uncharacterized protein n=1 Tax=Pseudomonas asuensis TaxID=1825787 RepID=A0ABQ2H177_9PSED|nr:hypothetical protein [Pseudomonas asuensis]GGM25360.1 hypothetical protein GCM10009425_40170 [Pseudomonas asuensis]